MLFIKSMGVCAGRGVVFLTVNMEMRAIDIWVGLSVGAVSTFRDPIPLIVFSRHEHSTFSSSPFLSKLLHLTSYNYYNICTSIKKMDLYR